MHKNHLHTDVFPVSKLIDNYISWKQFNNPDGGKRRFSHYHPSAFGSCLRKMQYQKYEEEGLFSTEKEIYEPALMRIFENGHDVHERWRRYFEDLDILRGYWKCANHNCLAYDDSGKLDVSKIDKIKERRIYGTDNIIGCFKPSSCFCGCKKFHYDEILVKSEELNLEGHTDAVLDFSQFDINKWGKDILAGIEELPQKPIVVDMKSINHFGFQDVATGTPHDYYITQLVIYINILNCEYGMLWYENKNNQRTTCFKVDRDLEMWEDIKKAAIQMKEMAEVTDDNAEKLYLLPPPKPFYKIDKKCDDCVYKNICHSSSIWEDPDLLQIRQEFYGKML